MWLWTSLRLWLDLRTSLLLRTSLRLWLDLRTSLRLRTDRLSLTRYLPLRVLPLQLLLLSLLVRRRRAWLVLNRGRMLRLRHSSRLRFGLRTGWLRLVCRPSLLLRHRPPTVTGLRLVAPRKSGLPTPLLRRCPPSPVPRGKAPLHRPLSVPNLRPADRGQSRRSHPVRRLPLRQHRHRRTSMVLRRKLLPVRRRLLRPLPLHLHRRHSLLMQHRYIGGSRPRIPAARPVVTHARIVYHRYIAHIHVVHHVHVYPVDGVVIEESGAIPVPTLVAMAGVPEPVRHASIEPDMLPPEAMVEPVPPTVETPVSGRPQCSNKWRRNPGSRHPVVPLRRIAPVARRPLIARIR